MDEIDRMDITQPAAIKEELLDDAEFDVADDNRLHLSDVETEDDNDDVIIVEAEKTMQYLSGIAELC